MGLRQLDEITVAWTEITRARYRRDDLEYASDLRDAEWAPIEPLMPGANRLGRPRRTDLRRWSMEIVRCSDRAERFVARPKRWIVERPFVWLCCCRRLSEDVEATLCASQTWMTIAHIRRLVREISRTADHATF